MGAAVLTADSRLSSKARFFRLDHILTFMPVRDPKHRPGLFRHSLVIRVISKIFKSELLV